MPKPTIREIAAFLADVRALRSGYGDSAALAARKADLLERIAEATPDDEKAAAVAQAARAAADRAQGT